MRMPSQFSLIDSHADAAPVSRSRAVRMGLLDVAAVGLYLGILAMICWRLYEHWPLPGKGSADRWALASFRDAIYYPIAAVRDGVNPYDVVRNDDPTRYMQRYPVTDTLPLYSPLVLLIFAPFGTLPVDASMVAFAAMNAVLIVALAWLTLRAIGRNATVAGTFGLAALLLASQPGRGVFNSGQVSLPLAVATLGALQWCDRKNWWSAVLVAFTTFKPTYGGPLGLLFAGRRNWRAAIGGLAIGGILACAGLWIVFARSGTHSIEEGVAVLLANQSDFSQDPTVVPQTNKARVDLVSALEYLVGHSLPGWMVPVTALVVLSASGWALGRLRGQADDKLVISTTGAMAILAMYVCVYHNVYDLPLLIVPLVAAATSAHPSWRQMGSFSRWMLVALMLVPFLNVLWTDGSRGRAEDLGIAWGDAEGMPLAWAFRGCCAANGLALAAAWGILLINLTRQRAKTPANAARVGHSISPMLSQPVLSEVS